MLADSYGRVATDLRVSLTDRCNLRCAYCMPPEGLDWLPGDEVLTGDEIVRLITIGVTRLGIREVRFTGGEPLLRRDLESIVSRTAALSPRPEISLTTNGIGLSRRAGALREAGVDRINVSLDTLRPEVFRKLARRDRLPDVLRTSGSRSRRASLRNTSGRSVSSDTLIRSTPASRSAPARRESPIPLVVSEISGRGDSAAVRETIDSRSRRSSGSPPVN